jgi:hypothetical protein
MLSVSQVSPLSLVHHQLSPKGYPDATRHVTANTLLTLVSVEVLVL